MSKLSNEGFLHRLIRLKHTEHLKSLGHDVKTTKVGVAFLLKNGIKKYPDIIDYTEKKIWEVQNSGDKKDDVFDNLPDGWSCGYVFISHNNTREDYIYKSNGDVEHVKWI